MKPMLEHYWTHGGIECAVIFFPNTWNLNGDSGHRCGYVRVPEGHPWHGIAYNEQVSGAAPNPERTADPDKMGLTGMLAVLSGDSEYLTRLDGLVEVHGGLTFGAGKPHEDLIGEDWIGFDCAHYGDSLFRWRLEAVVAETERLAEQVLAAGAKERAHA